MSEYIVDFGSLAMLSRVVESESNRLGEPVVRCRDCKHLNKLSRKHEAYACCLTCMEVSPYGFCAWGERRTNDN